MDVNKCVNFNGPEITVDRRSASIRSRRRSWSARTRTSRTSALSTASSSRARLVRPLVTRHRPRRIDPAEGRERASKAENVIVTQDVTARTRDQRDPREVRRARRPAREPHRRHDQRATSSPRAAPRTVRTPRASSRWATSSPTRCSRRTAPTDFGGAVAAFMNSGRRPRRACSSRRSAVGELPGEVTYGEAFTVQPFGNTLVVKTCTGPADLRRAQPAVQQPGAGAATGSCCRPPTSTTTGRRVGDACTSSTARCRSTTAATFVDKAASYRVAMNNFIADGGDGFTVFSSVHRPARR